MWNIWNKPEEASNEEAGQGTEEQTQQEGEKPRNIRDLSDEELQLEYVNAKAFYKEKADSSTTKRLAIARREMRRRQLSEEDPK